jgi:quinolinate synthase
VEALENMKPEIYVPKDVADAARASLERMLEVAPA